MEFEAKKVLIAGGSGLIGYSAAQVFIEKGAFVTSLCLPVGEENKKYFEGMDLVETDLFESTDEELEDIFTLADYDLFVYAVSPDFREVVTAPAKDYFDLRLRDLTKRILTLVKKVGIKRAVVVSGYLLHFDEQPGTNAILSSTHPYVNALAMQEAEAISLKDENFDVVFARIPLVFGSLPFEASKWKEFLLDKLQNGAAVLCPRGGSNMVSARAAGEGVYACSVNGKSGKKYLIGNSKVSYFDMMSAMFGTIGDKRKIIPAANWVITSLLTGFKLYLKANKKDLGLDLTKVGTQILDKNLYYDCAEDEAELNYEELGLKTDTDVLLCIKQMMRYCYPDKFDENGNLLAK